MAKFIRKRKFTHNIRLTSVDGVSLESMGVIYHQIGNNLKICMSQLENGLKKIAMVNLVYFLLMMVGILMQFILGVHIILNLNLTQ